MKRFAILFISVLGSFTSLSARTNEADSTLAVPRMQSAARMLEAFDSAYASLDTTGFVNTVKITQPDSVTMSLRADDSLMYNNPLYDEVHSPAEISVNEDSLKAIYESFQRSLEGGIDPKYDPYFQNYNPKPWKAVWYAALFPGGGQIYNRKYWKLPIIYGGFLALLYGYNWNQRYYRTYVNAYRDLVQNSPNASYLKFLPPNYPVSARREYLERVFKNKKNTYRNWRDYCILGMIGVYLVAMVDAYVDASLYHFDISTNLGPDDKPEVSVGYTIDF